MKKNKKKKENKNKNDGVGTPSFFIGNILVICIDFKINKYLIFI